MLLSVPSSQQGPGERWDRVGRGVSRLPLSSEHCKGSGCFVGKESGAKVPQPLSRNSEESASSAPAWEWGQTPRVERGPGTQEAPLILDPVISSAVVAPEVAGYVKSLAGPSSAVPTAAQYQSKVGPAPKGRGALPSEHLDALYLKTPTKLVTVSS